MTEIELIGKIYVLACYTVMLRSRNVTIFKTFSRLFIKNKTQKESFSIYIQALGCLSAGAFNAINDKMSKVTEGCECALDEKNMNLKEYKQSNTT